MPPVQNLEERITYRASRWGQIYHNLKHNEALGAGSAGPGKTLVLIMEPFQQIQIEHKRMMEAIDHPFPLQRGASLGWALHLRRTYKELKQTISRTKKIFPQIDPGCRWIEESSELDMGWLFSSGFKYQFGHCKDPDDWEMYQSSEFTGIYFDELVQFNEEQYDQIRSRLRSADPVLGDPERRLLKTRAMSNPFMRRTKDDNFSIHNPHWVRDRFVKPAPAGNVTLERELIRGDGRSEIITSIYVPARLSDNPNKAFVDQYEVQLLSLPAPIRKALLDGNWWVTQGSHYKAWDPNIHTCRPFRIPHDWPIWRSCDWGFKKPGCVHWWTMDEDGNVFCIRELTFQGKLVHEVAAEIQKIETIMGVWKGKRSTLTGPADSQLWEKRGDSAQSKADIFRELGIIWVVADKRSRQNNAERLDHRLKDHAGGTTTPGIVFFDTCHDAIRTIPSIQTSASNPEEPEDGGEDHWADSAVYSCAYASHGRAGIAGGPKDDDDEFDDEPAQQHRGAHGYGSALA